LRNTYNKIISIKNLTMIRFHKILFLISLFTFSVFAQEKKYQSLLWEISGNGLEKKSYIYGSMHVSEKISYHLSDAFFNHLLEADFVANESEPTTWSDLYNLFDFNFNGPDEHFFRSFHPIVFNKRQMLSLFQTRNFTMDNLLFRTNEYRQDYQEDTYLDMFIYQTGRKHQKKTLGLEDAKESIISLMDLDFDDFESIEDNAYKINRVLKGKSVEEALMDFYRERDLDMMDSLMILTSPQSYLEAMLYHRNIIMAKSIDSIAKKGSLFAAIGAAHIPGKKGVVELLREKGYTMKPITGDYTEKGKNIKKQIDELFVKPEFVNATTTDGMVQYKRFNMNLQMGEDHNSPDLVNGGYIHLKRKPLNDFLKKENDKFNHLSLDSLFYENIPGEILSKTFFEHESGVGYDLKSKTKTGNAQRYKFYITPLEIIALQMIGNGEYVRNFEKEIFSTISLKKPSSLWKTINVTNSNIIVDMPEYNIIYGDNNKKSGAENLEIYAYDFSNKSYFVFLERTLEEFWNIEETSFELKRIQEEFLFQFDPEAVLQVVEEKENFIIGQTSFKGRKLNMKTIIHGSKYYLMATFDADTDNVIRFFKSFQRTQYSDLKDLSEYINKEYYFKVNIPKKDNELLFLKPSKKKKAPKSKKTDLFESGSERFYLRGPGNRSVFINAYKYHPYESEKSIDSLMNDFRNWYKKSEISPETTEEEETDEEIALNDFIFSDSQKTLYKNNWDKELGWDKWLKRRNQWEIVSERIIEDKENQIYGIEAVVTKSGSSQAIRYKALFKDGMQYRIRSLVPLNSKDEHPFIQNVFNSFQLLSSKPSTSVFEKKLSVFIKDALSENDTLRYTALKGIDRLSILPEELKTLQLFLNSFEFKSEETEFLIQLYDKIGNIKHPDVIPFLEINYKKESQNPLNQLAILKALTKQKSKSAYKKILELMEFDLPLTDSKYEIDNLFNLFKRDISHSEVLFPDIFQFYTIKEYHDPVLHFTNELIIQQKTSSNKLKSYKKMVLTNAKLEYKRVAGWKAKRESQDTNFSTAGNSGNTNNLIKYLPLIYPYKKEKDFSDLILKIQNLDIESIMMEIVKLELKQNGKLPEELQKRLLENPYLQFPVTQMLFQNKNHPQNETLNEEKFSKVALLYHLKLNEKKVEVNFEDKIIVNHNNKDISVFFFKISPKKNGERNYYGNEEAITAVAFVQQPKKEIINPTAFAFSKKITIEDEDDIPYLKKELVDRIINQHRLRISFGRSNDSFGWDFNDIYDDY